MNNANEGIIFDPETKVKIGAVTYIVAAHFSSEGESLKSKINHLLISDLQKQNPVYTFADSQRGDVE